VNGAHRESPAPTAAVGGSATDRGPVRAVNEDRVLCDDRYGLYAVFDGVGGHNAGEVAAQLALETVAGYIARSASDADDDTWPLGWDARFSSTTNRLRTAVILANQRVHLAAQSDPDLEGMATTVAAVLVAGNVVSFAHVGDSRIYRLDPGPSRLLTEDDAATVDQLDADGERIGSRRALTRALGAESEVRPSMAEMPAPPHIRLMLCSDGLHGVVGVEEIDAQALTGAPQEVAERLMRQAIEADTRDNVSVLIVDVGERT
jgi:PPM family protein phosphatase